MTRTPPDAARSALDTAPNAPRAHVSAPAGDSPAAAVLAALTAEPGDATVAVIARHAQISVAAPAPAPGGRRRPRHQCGDHGQCRVTEVCAVRRAQNGKAVPAALPSVSSADGLGVCLPGFGALQPRSNVGAAA